ncbi:MAG: hypothetical protein CK426_09370, partial [Legionella sp.]
ACKLHSGVLSRNISRGFLTGLRESPGKERLFHASLAVDVAPYLADHKVYGQIVFPATGYIELCIESLSEIREQGVFCFADITFERVLHLDPALATLLHVLINEQQQISVYSFNEKEEWLRHCTLTCMETSQFVTQHLHIKKEIMQAETITSGALFYADAKKRGLLLGSAFQGIQTIYEHKDGALIEIALPVSEIYRSHPAVLDSCLQSVGALSHYRLATEGQTYLPVGIKRFLLQDSLPGHIWVKINKADLIISSQGFHLNLEIYTEQGHLVARLDGLEFKAVSARQLQWAGIHDSHRNSSSYQLVWEPHACILNNRPLNSGHSHWLLLHDSKEFKDAFTEFLQTTDQQVSCVDTQSADFATRLQACLLNTTYSRILYASLDNTVTDSTLPDQIYTHSVHLLESIQIIVRYYRYQNEKQPSFYLLTRDEFMHAALWGIGRTAQQEYADWDIRLIQWDGQKGYTHLAQALGINHFDSCQENQFYLTAELWSVCRLLAHPIAAEKDRSSMAWEGVYLITGGLSGIGYQVCQWLVSQGVQCIALLSRRDANLEQQAQFATWLEQGIKVHAYAVDVGDWQALSLVYKKISEDLGPIKNVIHSAGVLSDATLLNQKTSYYEAVYRAKVYGAWYLHELTRTETLENFIVFSSASAYLGTQGQSNYVAANSFLDQLMQYRRAQGLPGLSIQWGLWRALGMSEELAQNTAVRQHALSVKEGLDYFHQVIANQDTPAVISILAMDWSLYQQQRPYQPLLSSLVSYHGIVQQKEDLLSQLQRLPQDKAKALMQHYVAQLVAKLLHHPGTEMPDVTAGFFELGLDSLITAQLIQQVESALQYQIQLKPQNLFDHSNIAALTDYLLKQLMIVDKVEIDTKTDIFSHHKEEDIAIISMNCRFPGNCNSVDDYWNLLLEGKDGLIDIPEDRWNFPGISQQQMYVKKGGFIKDIAQFDASFFKISSKEAQFLDPQQRLLLEVTEHLLEQAGLAREQLKNSKTGVFIGMCSTDYANLMRDTLPLSEFNLYLATGNTNSTASGRISFYYGFDGPCVTLDTACSSSLVSVHLACQSLRLGESNLAIAGGAALMLDVRTTLSFCEGK